MRHHIQTKHSLAFVVGLILFSALAPGGVSAAPAAPDFDAAHDELVKLLAGFVKIDTSNPPGNETRGAEYLKQFLDHEGIASEILTLEKNRGNLVARLKGNGKKKPLLLMGHTDVVGVERDKWTVDPFGAVIKNGFLYGRGASDDKGMTAACLEVFLLLHRLKVPLDRDVIYLAEAGEEGTTQAGIDFLVAKHWDKIACEFALNEGGRIILRDDKVHYVSISTAEKVPRPFILSAKGTSGHGSRPRADNPITHLAAAVAKIGNWQAPTRLNDTTRNFFNGLAKISTPEEAFLFKHIEDPVVGGVVQDLLRQKHAAYYATLHTTLVPTTMKGGFRINVIPGDALAMIDVRAMPDEDIEKLAAELRKLIDDPLVEVVPPAPGGRPATAPSRTDTEMFAALTRAQKKMFPEGATLPTMNLGATDSAQLRAKGVQAYGVGPAAGEKEISGVHGNDERISLAGLRKFLEYLWAVTVDVAATK